jgi:hypothetical protein
MAHPRAWLILCLLLGTGCARAATEIGMVTLADGGPRLLRGTTWYLLAPGVRVEEGDIVALAERGQVQVELTAGTIANLAGGGALYLAATPKGGAQVLVLPAGWLKVAAKVPGVRLRTPPFDVSAPDAILVVHAEPALAEVFIEAGTARIAEPGAAEAAARDAKRGEFWSRSAGGTFATVARAPKAFVDAMPRPYTDPLPMLAPKLKSSPAPVADHEITFAEAESWLEGPDRAVFERRFAPRLRDPAFRKAVEPHLARHPAWDRQLHPEKYKPKEAKGSP